MKTRTILDVNDQPFANFDAALWWRNCLIQETEAHHRYQIDRWDEGFVITKIQTLIDDQTELDPNDSKPDFDQQMALSNPSENDSAGEAWVFRPSLRSWLTQLPVILLGMGLVIFSESLLKSLWIDYQWGRFVPVSFFLPINTGLAGLGLVIVAWTSGQIIYQTLASCLIVDAQGVTQKTGIIAQGQITIRNADIKTIAYRQGLIDRLLNIGVLELDSAGTDGIDIRFQRLAHPKRLRNLLMERLNQTSRT